MSLTWINFDDRHYDLIFTTMKLIMIWKSHIMIMTISHHDDLSFSSDLHSDSFLLDPRVTVAAKPFLYRARAAVSPFLLISLAAFQQSPVFDLAQFWANAPVAVFAAIEVDLLLLVCKAGCSIRHHWLPFDVQVNVKEPKQILVWKTGIIWFVVDL